MLGALRGWADDDARGYGDGDGKITATEVVDFVRSALDATAHGQKQTPEVIGDANFVLASMPKSGLERGPDLAHIQRRLKDGSSGAPAADVQPRPVPERAHVQVSAAWKHSCGVKPDGHVACWGRNDQGQSSPPAGRFVQVSAGKLNTCGVKTDGRVACWGSNEHGASTPAPGSFVQLSAGYQHACGVKLDGSVACWGLGMFGSGRGFSTPPPGANLRSISGSQSQYCGVTMAGRVTCWGNDNDSGNMTPPAGW